MTELDVHPADDAERLAIFRNVHDVWGAGLSLEEHVARRSGSVSHRRSEWFAGVVGGEVVVSCGCQPFVFRLRGEIVPGFGFRAVHTRADHRGRGLAPRFLAEVERQRREGGDRLAILYSDIGLDYYARLGYLPGRSHTGLATVAIDAGSTSDWTELPPREYAAARDRIASRHAITIERTGEYESHLSEFEPNLRSFVVEEGGAFRLKESDDHAWIAEAAWPDDAVARERMATAIVGIARDAGLPTVRGWLPDDPAVRTVFDVRPRETELTMLKPLDPSVILDDSILAATDWWYEIDHV